MTARESIWRMIDRLMSFLPGPPDEQTRPSSFPDPNEPGLSPREREARLELMRKSLGKDGHGGFR